MKTQHCTLSLKRILKAKREHGISLYKSNTDGQTVEKKKNEPARSKTRERPAGARTAHAMLSVQT